MNLPLFFFFSDIEGLGVSIILNNRLYTIDNNIKSNYKLYFLDRGYNLHKGQKIKQFEEDFLKKNRDIIETFRDDEFIKEKFTFR